MPKIVLYDCQTISEFKEKLGIHEKIFSDTQQFSFNLQIIVALMTSEAFCQMMSSYTQLIPIEHLKIKKKKKKKLCFNCNSTEDLSKLCPGKHCRPKCLFGSAF